MTPEEKTALVARIREIGGKQAIDMWRAKHYGEILDLKGAILIGEDLRGTDLSGADLRGAILIESYIRGADLSLADLRGANLEGANLMGAILIKTDLRGTNLSKANLRGAKLIEADLREAILGGTDLRGAQLMLARLDEARITPEQLSITNFFGAKGLPDEVADAALAIVRASLNKANAKAEAEKLTAYTPPTK